MSLLDGKTRYVYLLSAELTPDAPEQEWHDWYDNTHVPDLMTVPGFVSGTRFRELANPRRFLAGYQIERPGVFEEPRYAEVTGWRQWEPYVANWERGVYEVTRREF